MAHFRKKWGGGTSIYQTFFVNKKLYDRFLVYKIQERQIPIFYVVYEDKAPVLIVPLSKFMGDDIYSSFGDCNGVRYYDFIYNHNQSSEDIIRYVSFFMNLIKGKFRIRNVVPNSMLLSFFKEKADCVEDAVSVNISFGGDYETYYNALSKHSKQNIRTAYNRLKRDNHIFDLRIYDGETIEDIVKKQVLDLYAKRHELRYKEATSIFKKIYLRRFDFATRLQFGKELGFTAILYIDGKLSAFLSGLRDWSNKSIIVPRLSINDDYSWYSPGIILLNETVKKLIERKELTNLDLSIGTEPYKLTMGGNTYLKSNFIFN